MGDSSSRLLPGTYRPERRYPRPGDRLLTGAEVAQLVGVASQTVSLWARQGRVPSILTPDKSYLFRESEIRSLLGVPDGR